MEKKIKYRFLFKDLEEAKKKILLIDPTILNFSIKNNYLYFDSFINNSEWEKETKYKCIVSYIGKKYNGWIGGNNSISNIIENLLKKIDNNIKIFGASRTDQSTNAKGQCFHFSTFYSEIRWEKFLKKLPYDIKIESIEKVSEDFQARFNAKYRIYRYYITKKDIVFFRDLCFFFTYNLEEINIRIKDLMLKNNFDNFCNGEKNVNMEYIKYFYTKFFSEKILILEFKAKCFFYHQIRRIVYFLLTGKISGLVPAHGLYLEKVIYKKLN